MTSLKQSINNIYKDQIDTLINENKAQRIRDVIKIQRLEFEILAIKTRKRVVEINPSDSGDHREVKPVIAEHKREEELKKIEERRKAVELIQAEKLKQEEARGKTEYEFTLAQQQKDDNQNGEYYNYKIKLEKEYAEGLPNLMKYFTQEITKIYEEQINKLINENNAQRIRDANKIQILEFEIFALKTGERVNENNPSKSNDHYNIKQKTESDGIRNHNHNMVDNTPVAEQHSIKIKN